MNYSDDEYQAIIDEYDEQTEEVSHVMDMMLDQLRENNFNPRIVAHTIIAKGFDLLLSIGDTREEILAAIEEGSREFETKPKPKQEAN